MGRVCALDVGPEVDPFYGASKQKERRKARRQAIDELRREAYSVDADGVIGGTLRDNEFRGFVVASGTAVTFKDENQSED